MSNASSYLLVLDHSLVCAIRCCLVAVVGLGFVSGDMRRTGTKSRGLRSCAKVKVSGCNIPSYLTYLTYLIFPPKNNVGLPSFPTIAQFASPAPLFTDLVAL